MAEQLYRGDDILELIKSRRSIKEFSQKHVNWEQLARIMDAGRHAPCTGNIQNWKFIVSTDTSQKQALAAASHDQYFMVAAPALITICGDVDKGERYYGQRGREFYTTQNCSAAAMTMILEAQSLGLGTCWISAFDEDKIKGILGLPVEMRPIVMIAVGYPEVIPPKPPKYPLEALAYLGGWRSRIRDIHKYLGTYSAFLARNVGHAKAKVNALTGKVKEKLPSQEELAAKLKELTKGSDSKRDEE